MSLTPASDMLRADHRQMEVWIDRLLEVAKHPPPDLINDVRRIFTEIQLLTAPHFNKEESVFYPRLRPILPDLLTLLDEQHAYIHEVEDNLRELIATVGDEPSDRELTELFRFSVELFDTVQHHIVDEEDQLLRVADSQLSPEEQDQLAEAMKAVEMQRD
ncbi:MAG: hemerythrin domain-containing protein [Candidatus Sulfotelmatobacter sp.]|jgi:hemerythrin-like domain-containing protein